MAKSKIDIIYDMVDLAYDVKRQCGRDKTLNYYIGDYARDVIKAKDEKVYDEFIYLAKQLEAEGWEEFIDWSKNLIKEYNQIEESKKSMKESEENFVYYIAVYDEDGSCRGYLQNESWRITQDIDKAMHFKRDVDAREVILKATKCAFNDDELYIEGMYLNESKESARKSMKESINGDCYIYYEDNGEIYGKKRRWVFCDNVKGITNTRDFFPLNDFIIDAIHIFKNEKQAQKFIDVDCKYFEDKNKLVIAEYPQTVSGFFESKKSATKSIKEVNESVIINGKKTNFKINDYGTFFSEKIKYMLIGKPLENENVLADFLEENSNFEFEEYKIPYSTVYYIYNDEKSLFGVAYMHYIRLTNNEKDAKIMLAYATNKRDLYNGL